MVRDACHGVTGTELCLKKWSKAGKEMGMIEADKHTDSIQILLAAQGWKSSQSKQHRLTELQTTGLRAVWPWGSSTAWRSGSLRRCPLIFPCCFSKESAAGPVSGRDGISDSALLGFLDRHGGIFCERGKTLLKALSVPLARGVF